MRCRKPKRKAKVQKRSQSTYCSVVESLNMNLPIQGLPYLFMKSRKSLLTTSNTYIDDRLLSVTLTLGNSHIHLICVYAPDTSRAREETINFYDKLQAELDEILRVGNRKVSGVLQKFNEDVSNSQGDILTEFCAQNELRINAFFRHKPQHTYTWSNSRGQRSVIDYSMRRPTETITGKNSI